MSDKAVPNPRHILLAVDGSEHSRAAVEFVSALPLPEGCTVSILAVIYRRDSQLQAALTAVVEQTRSALSHKNLTLVPQVLEGHPAEAITQYAQQHACDLVAVGAVGLRATLGIMLGGVAQQVVEYAPCPVLVVRAPYTGLKRAMLVTDGSACSQRALKTLSRFPLPAETDIQIMHVLTPAVTVERIAAAWPVGAGMLMYPTSDEMMADVENWEAQEKEAGKKLLSASVSIFTGSGRQVFSLLTRGDAATEILHEAKNHQADLIVAGSRGLSQVRGWLMGSVSRKLVYHASCSVLVVKGTPGDSEACA